MIISFGLNKPGEDEKNLRSITIPLRKVQKLPDRTWRGTLNIPGVLGGGFDAVVEVYVTLEESDTVEHKTM